MFTRELLKKTGNMHTTEKRPKSNTGRNNRLLRSFLMADCNSSMAFYNSYNRYIKLCLLYLEDVAQPPLFCLGFWTSCNMKGLLRLLSLIHISEPTRRTPI